MTTKAQCIKQKNLEKLGYDNIEDWCSTYNNIYVGRNWRINIYKYNQEQGKKLREKTKVLKASKWENPFSLKHYSLKTSLILYVLNLFKTGLINDIHELNGKTLGCWCDFQEVNGVPHCHAQVLADLINKCHKFI
jgi:hypothetical protein